MIKAILKRPISIPLAASGGVLASQLPQAYGQYTQYLQGRVDEAAQVAQRAATRLADISATYGVETIELAKQLLSTESGRAARAVEGDIAVFEGDLGRYEWLQQALANLTDAAPVVRLGAFASNLQPEFVSGTLKNYHPGLPAAFNLGGIAEIAIVVGAGLVAFYAIGRAIELAVVRSIKAKKGGETEALKVAESNQYE